MELDDQTPETPESLNKNIAHEITSLRNDIKEDNDIIMKYTITKNNLNSQKNLQEYLDMIEYYEERRTTNLELLKTKIQELINHPLNTISPSSKKREREITPSQSGGTKKRRRKNKRKRTSKVNKY
jgi:hypothetical protein